MTEENKSPRMRPMMILPPKAVSEINIKRLRENGICVIIAKDPSALRFCEPPLFNYTQDYNAQEKAAIELSKSILTNIHGMDATYFKKDLMKVYVDTLLKASPLNALKVEPIKKP